MANAIEEAINRPTSEDDTHPSPTDRFRLVSRMASQPVSASSGAVWDLFADRDALTREMNTRIEERIKAAG
jgi:hypothetical protein